MDEPGLVPELLVGDIERSIEFWCSTCGLEVRYARPEERFAYIMPGTAHLMLEEVGVGRNWITGPLERPLGRGINVHIVVADADAVAVALGAAGIELFMPPETKRYRVGTDVAAVRQFLVADPDGHLVRFQTSVDG